MKNEILHSVFLPWTKKYEYVKEFKQAHRRDDDIALVNAGMRVSFVERDGTLVVDDASLVYGGVGPLPLCAKQTEEFLLGSEWNEITLRKSLKVLQEDIVIQNNAPGGMEEFRSSLVASFFFKFFLFSAFKLEHEGKLCHNFPNTYKSAVMNRHRPPSVSSQTYQASESGNAVGYPTMHMSARLQVYARNLSVICEQ